MGERSFASPNLGHSLGLQGSLARGHFVDDQSKCVDVGAFVELLQCDLLWRTVVRCADEDPVLGQTMPSDQACEPEVGKKRFPVFVYQNVAGLDVAVENVEAMAAASADESLVARAKTSDVGSAPRSAMTSASVPPFIHCIVR